MITHLDRVISPEAWPAPPSTVSFSTMSDIEACPRRWALANAEYPGIWDHSGYPQRTLYGAARGDIVHASVELLFKALRSKGCSTLRSKEATAVLRELGGFTKVIEQERDNFIERQRSNPRMEKVLPDLERRLTKDLSDQKSLVQRMVLSTQIANGPAESIMEDEGGVSATGNMIRAPLGMGSHTEVFLQSEETGWLGIADLITISPDLCEIRDFKTGGEEEHHADQLRTYAALWYNDQRVNPAPLRANRLIVTYRDRDAEIPAPSAEEINEIAADLKGRKYAATLALSANPPEARPSADNCRWCSVKQLCDDYWVESVHQRIFDETKENNQPIDAQLKLDYRSHSLEWLATVDCAGELTDGARVIVMLQTPDEDLRTGQTIRIVGAGTGSGDDTEAQDVGYPRIEFTPTTERFLMS